MNKTYIIAEAGVNHNGDKDIAFKLVEAAAQAGADAVKFQTFIASESISKYADKAKYQNRNLKDDKSSQLEMIKKLELNFDDFEDIHRLCKKKNIEFITTPFDKRSVDFCDKLVNKFKIASGEITNLPLLEYITRKNKPIILSTGMCYLGDIEQAIDVILKENNYTNKKFPALSLLHCTTNYPCPYQEVNLNAIGTLSECFQVPVGYSDHTEGIEISLAAVALGAKIIEKHFTLDKSLPGPDHKASLGPQELEKMITSIRNIDMAMGDGIKKPNKSELEIMKVARKSLVANTDLKPGQKITEDSISIKRPGTGIPPSDLYKIIGLILKKSKRVDETLTWEDFK